MFNRTGTTADGSPYITFAPSNFAAGASITITLEFDNPTLKGITYTTRVLAGLGP